MTYLRTGELIVSNPVKLISRAELNHVNDLVNEYDYVSRLIQQEEGKNLTSALPMAIREKVSRMIDTELRAREAEIKATLQNQFQVKV